MYPYIILLIYCFTQVFAGCPTNSIIDASMFSRELYNMRKQLGGHTDVDLWFPFFKYASPFGQFKISCVCDLECYDFDSFLTHACKWRNERNSCDGFNDELDFTRMKGAWGEDEGRTIFGKKDRADGYFLITGIEKKLPPNYSAMLVSDPIQCQEGDGVLKMKYWTSPSVKVRVCIRPPSQGKRYDWCSEPIRRNSSEEAKVIIPGTIQYTFEIVIEAYNFVFDAFGKQGGAAIIDDISYNASAIYNCKMIPHYEPLSTIPAKSCASVQCNFDFGVCLRKLEDTGWETTDEPIGPKTTGINQTLDGKFAYVRGPGTSSFALGPFHLPRYFAIEFCYYSASFGSQLILYLAKEDDEEKRDIIFKSADVNGGSQQWMCEKVMIPNGTYAFVEFSAEKLRNEFSYMAVDQIAFVDPMKGIGACGLQQRDNALLLRDSDSAFSLAMTKIDGSQKSEEEEGGTSDPAVMENDFGENIFALDGFEKFGGGELRPFGGGKRPDSDGLEKDSENSTTSSDMNNEDNIRSTIETITLSSVKLTIPTKMSIKELKLTDEAKERILGSLLTRPSRVSLGPDKFFRAAHHRRILIRENPPDELDWKIKTNLMQSWQRIQILKRRYRTFVRI